MKEITNLISNSKGSYEESKIKRFKQLIKGKSEKEIRKIEQSLLKPIPIPKYRGPTAQKSDIEKRTIEITFPSETYIKRFAQFIKINTYIKCNTYDTEKLIELLRLMEEGRIRWNKTQRCYFFKERVGRRIRL